MPGILSAVCQQGGLNVVRFLQLSAVSPSSQKMLKTAQKREKYVQERLDTYGFAISRSPVQARRVGRQLFNIRV